MRENIRLAVTGSSGYLGQRILEMCKGNPAIAFTLGLDIRRPDKPLENYFVQRDVREGDLGTIWKQCGINTVMHLAWVFDPSHDEKRSYDINVRGTANVLAACREAGVKRVIYAGSTTAYGPWPDNPDDPGMMTESYPRRGSARYQYARDKATVDGMVVQWMLENPDTQTTLFRAEIVLGPHAKNIVTYVVDFPVMFRIAGYDPPMQFVGEQDMENLLYESVVRERAHGIYNVAGDEPILYSTVCSIVGKPTITLPAALLYPSSSMLWALHALPYPSSLLDFIRYPWLASTEKLKKEFGFNPKQTSEGALRSYLASK